MGLACVVNVSEGRDERVLARLAAAAGRSLLDLHSDPWHNRSVFTLAGEAVEEDARELARRAVDLLDVTTHSGVHPRLGVLDVVPFTPFPPTGPCDPRLGDRADAELAAALAPALAARDGFAAWAADELALPCFTYGPERTLPDVRRRAFVDLEPQAGPRSPHPRAGACCVGARFALVAYNLWLATDDVDLARRVARDIRGPHLRALGLGVGRHAQVSCNLVEPFCLGPADAYDLVHFRAPVARAELVGLVPDRVLRAIAPERWADLDLAPERTVEARAAARRAPGGG